MMNAVGTFNVTRLAAAAMARNVPDEHGQRGVVVNTASIAGMEGQTGQLAYAAAEGGDPGHDPLRWRADLAALGIRVCAIAPGTMGTPIMLSVPEAMRENLVQSIVFPKRMGRPEEFACSSSNRSRNPSSQRREHPARRRPALPAEVAERRDAAPPRRRGRSSSRRRSTSGRVADPDSSTSRRFQRAASSSIATRLSMRANAAPRQLCTPWPKPIATFGGRSMSKSSGVLELARVACRRAGDEQHRVAGRDGPALELAILHRVPALVLRRRHVPEDLLDGAGIVSGSSTTFCHWSGCCENSTTALPTSLVTVSAPAPPSNVAKPAISASSSPVSVPSPRSTVTCVSRDSMSSVGVLALLGHEVVQVRAGFQHRLLVLGARLELARLAAQADVDLVPDLLALSLGDADHARDDLDGERPGELGDDVEFVRVADRVEEAADDLADHRLERGDGAGREHAADERAEPVVLGRVHHDDAAVARDELGVCLPEGEELDAVRAGEPLPIAVRGHDVGEARQRVEPVLLAVVDRRLVAEAPVHLARVVEVLVRERIELDGLWSVIAACSSGGGGSGCDGDRRHRQRRAAAEHRVDDVDRAARPR